ncbi:MAG: ArnT family glycosyltransferase [Candidatus Omnitrophota bacterium]
MSQLPKTPSQENWIVRIFLWVMAAVLVYNFLNYAAYAFNLIVYPYDLDVGEGLIINRAWLLSKGENIYSPIDREPYFVMNYTPFFEFILAGLIKVFGPKIMLGRMLSVGAAVLSGYFIYKIVNNVTRQQVSALIAGLIFFTSSWLICWSVLCRIDVFALMFVLAGISLVTNQDQPKDFVAIFLSVLCFSAALYSRQSMIAAPVACAAWYGWNIIKGQDRKRNVEYFKLFLLLFFGITAGVLFALNCVTHGEFIRHTVFYTMSSFELSDFFKWFKEFWNTHWVLTGISALSVVIAFKKREMSVPEFFWLFSLLVTITAGKLGASINYFLEFWAANCVLTGLLLSRFERGALKWEAHLLGLFFFMLLIIQLLILHKRIDFTLPSAEYRQASNDMTELIRDSSGEVLSEYMGYALQNGKESVYQSFSMAQLALDGKWDEGRIINDLKNHRFGIIIMTGVGMEYDRWTPRFKDAINQYYKQTHIFPCFELSYYHHTINVHYVFEPKDSVTDASK